MPDAQSPEVVTTDIYTDAGPLTWTFLTGDVTRDLQAEVGYNNEGVIDISVSEVAVEGRGVLDVMSDGGVTWLLTQLMATSLISTVIAVVVS